jgi:hypothetical protein
MMQCSYVEQPTIGPNVYGPLWSLLLSQEPTEVGVMDYARGWQIPLSIMRIVARNRPSAVKRVI